MGWLIAHSPATLSLEALLTPKRGRLCQAQGQGTLAGEGEEMWALPGAKLCASSFHIQLSQCPPSWDRAPFTDVETGAQMG